MFSDFSELPKVPARPLAFEGYVFNFDGRSIANGPKRHFWSDLPCAHKRAIFGTYGSFGLREMKIISAEAWSLWSRWNEGEEPQRIFKKAARQGWHHASPGSENNASEQADLSAVGTGDKKMPRAVFVARTEDF